MNLHRAEHKRYQSSASQPLLGILLLVLGLIGIGCDRATRPERTAAVTVQYVIVENRLASADEIRRVRITRQSHHMAGGKTTVLVSPDTQAVIGDNSLLAIIGNLFVKTKDYFKVETVYGTAAPEGTMFDVDISDKQVVFAAFEGTVRVEPKDAAVQPVLLQPSEETILLKDAATRGVPCGDFAE